ncbi:Poly(A) polymerase [gamma proteobacterium HdN1]|nr:Poly(A) polymerase [gamma proteobacterium HdN1]
MAKRLFSKIKKLFSPKPSSKRGPELVPVSQHGFPASKVSPGARRVLETLTQSGYSAYLVGGSIRDGLLGISPKDFDVATNATPEQIRQLFRSCRLIGQRFRLAHVRMGREIIEVATFRGHHHPDDDDDESNSEEAGNQKPRRASVSDEGMILRDNVFGTEHEDAMRRDFTANALFYRLSDGAIVDHVGGFADIQSRRLRLIGDPDTRFREDPVRILRAIRFAAKLDFAIDETLVKPIRDLGGLLDHVPAARLFEEIQKMFLSGYAAPVWQKLLEFGLAPQLFPLLVNLSDADHQMIRIAMQNTDTRIAEEKPVTPAFLLAVLLWPSLKREWERLKEDEDSAAPQFQQAAYRVISAQNHRISIPRRFQQPMREIWDLQQRLPRRQGKRADQVLEHPRFRAAYDFLLLREQAGEVPSGLAAWWERYQAADESTRRQMISELNTGAPRKSRRRRRRPPANASLPPSAPAS